MSFAQYQFDHQTSSSTLMYEVSESFGLADKTYNFKIEASTTDDNENTFGSASSILFDVLFKNPDCSEIRLDWYDSTTLLDDMLIDLGSDLAYNQVILPFADLDGYFDLGFCSEVTVRVEFN